MNALVSSLQSTIGSLRTWMIAAILALGSLDAAAQTVAPLFTPPPGGDAAGVRAGAKRAADRPYIARQRAVGVAFQQLQPQAGRSQLALSVDLFDGIALLADLDRVDVRSAKSYSWFGRIRGLPNSRATLTVVDGVLAGNLILLDEWNRVKGSYQIQSAGDGLYLLEEINPSAFPPDHPPGIDPHPEIPRVAADAPSLRDAAKADTLVTIDVLVVYSNEVASAAGSAIGAQIQAAVDAANTAYANSGINARLRLVHYAAANYAQNGNFSTDLNRLTGGGDGYMDDVHALRDAYGADMVSLWVEGGSYCGIGWVGPYASYAFTVVARGCATGNLTFAHELGHNMGALHDPYVDAGTSPYAYGHGHINLVARWRTVMSYNDLCAATPPGTSCTRIPYFSNPNLTYNGAALGTVEAGSTPTANNARVHNNGAATVAAFRPTVVGTTCTYTVSPTAASPTAAGGTATATVTTQSGCTWNASSSAAWLTISSGASGTGSGTVTYATAANAGAARSATLTVGGKTVTVNQAAACNYALSPTSASLTAAAGSGNVAVTVATGCTWSATSSASWLTVTSGASGNGNGTVGYAATANTGPTRSANLAIGGQTFVVTQANGCTYVASPTSVSAAAGAGSGSVAVTAGTGCTWSANSSASWLTVTSGASGSGNGSVGYAIAANTGAARSATLTVGGKTVTVNQAALSCNYTFAPTSGSFTAAAGSGSVAVTVPTGCAWTATSSASWLTVTSGASGNGNGTVGIAATANTGPARSASLTIGGQSYAVTQANGCTYVASPTSVSAAAGSGSGSVSVTAGTGCTWSASSSASWLTVTSGASGSGNGSVGYAIAANTGAARSATLSVGGKAVAVSQDAAVVSAPPPTGTNVALASAGAVASASSTHSAGFAVTAVNNGERAGANPGAGGYWNDGSQGAFPDWVQIDFNGNKTIDRVVVYTLQDNFTNPVEPSDSQTFTLYGIADFSIQAWNGSSWTTLGTVTGNNLVKRTVSFAPFTTSRIRISVAAVARGGPWSRVTEVEAWGY